MNPVRNIYSQFLLLALILPGCDFYDALDINEVYIEEQAIAKQVRDHLDIRAHWQGPSSILGTALVTDILTETWPEESPWKVLPFIEGISGSKEDRDIPWQIAHQNTLQAIYAVIDPNTITYQERLYSFNIQSRVMWLIYWRFLKEDPSPELAKALETYMEILMRHGSNELDVLAEAIVHTREFLPVERYNLYRQYVLNNAEIANQYAKDNIENSVNQYNDAIQNESMPNVDKKYFYVEMKRAQNMSIEAKYVRVLLEQ